MMWHWMPYKVWVALGLGRQIYTLVFSFFLNHTCNSSKTWSHNPYHKIVSFTSQFVWLVMSSVFADVITVFVLSDQFMNEQVFFKMQSLWNKKTFFSSDFSFVKLTPLGPWSGLGTQSRYKAPNNFQVKYVKYAVINIGWVRLSPQ